VLAFNLLAEDGHEFPAFINLQQYYAEQWLVEACEHAGVELRWRNRVVGVENLPDHVAARRVGDLPARAVADSVRAQYFAED